MKKSLISALLTVVKGGPGESAILSLEQNLTFFNRLIPIVLNLYFIKMHSLINWGIKNWWDGSLIKDI